MKIRPLSALRSLSMFLLLAFSIQLMPHLDSHAAEVVISPDKVTAPTFRTGGAICYGLYEETHINLGFGSGVFASITGVHDEDNKYCTIGGGFWNRATDEGSTVGGGYWNKANGSYSAVGGGEENMADGNWSTIGGGMENTADGQQSTVAGGNHNTASNVCSTVGGGFGNVASGHGSFVGGGGFNTASNYYSNVVGGSGNKSTGHSSTILGGEYNEVAGSYSVAGGRYMTLSDEADRTFVWGYADGRQPISTSNAFLIFPVGNSGKVGICKPDPGERLDIAAGNGRVEEGYHWLTNSDKRLKRNISTLENSLDKICHLRGVRFDSTKDESVCNGNAKHIGVIAQELEKEYPELVVGDEITGYKAVAYDKLTAVLIEAVKGLKAENDILKAENLAMREDIARIEAALGM